MAAVSRSHKITACAALMALICGVAVIAAGVWFAAAAQGEECARVAHWHVAIVGGFIFLVALAGFVGGYWNQRALLGFYLFAMAVLIVALAVFVIFGYVVTRGSGAYPLIGRAYHEYRLEGFSMWLRGYVSNDPARWDGIMSCLADSDTCRKLARQGRFATADQFYQTNLTPLQSGCCKPPSECGFGYVGPTVWTNPTSAPDQDCGLWSNNPAQLCYECESCRAGLLATLRNEWHKAGVVLIVAIIVLIFVYGVSWRAYRTGSLWSRRKC